MWRSFGLSVMEGIESGGHLSWPRVHVECDYKGIAQFEDNLDVAVRVLKLGTKSVTYGFTFTCDGRLVAEGKTVAVCCVVEGASLESIEIPDELRSRLAKYVVHEE